MEHSIPSVVTFEATSDLFKTAKPRDKYLWNFHSHHDAPYPSADSYCTLVKQIVFPSSGPCAGFVLLALLGLMPAWLCVTHHASQSHSSPTVPPRPEVTLVSEHLLQSI